MSDLHDLKKKIDSLPLPDKLRLAASLLEECLVSGRPELLALAKTVVENAHGELALYSMRRAR